MTTTQKIIDLATAQGQRIETLEVAIRQLHNQAWKTLEQQHKTCSSSEFNQLYGAYRVSFNLMREVLNQFAAKYPSDSVRERLEAEEKQSSTEDSTCSST